MISIFFDWNYILKILDMMIRKSNHSKNEKAI